MKEAARDVLAASPFPGGNDAVTDRRLAIELRQRSHRETVSAGADDAPQVVVSRPGRTGADRGL